MLGTGTEIAEVQEWAMLAEREIIHEGFEGYKAGSAGGGMTSKAFDHESSFCAYRRAVEQVFACCIASFRLYKSFVLELGTSTVLVVFQCSGIVDC